jgi:hypothetical protein
MCGGGSTPAAPPAPPPAPPAPTAPSPSASKLPDATAYTEAARRKDSAKNVRGQLRIELGTGGGKSVGTGINTNQ